MRAVPGMAGMMCGRTGIGGFFVTDFFVFFRRFAFAFFFNFHFFFGFVFKRFFEGERGWGGFGRVAVRGGGRQREGGEEQEGEEGEPVRHACIHRRSRAPP